MKIIIEVGDDPKRNPEDVMNAVKSVTESFLLEPAYEVEVDDDELINDTIDSSVTLNVALDKQDTGRITVESKSDNVYDVQQAVEDYLSNGGTIHEVDEGEWAVYDWFMA